MHMIALGFVFGIVACFSFVVSKPWIEGKLGGDPEQVTIPKDEEEQEETSGEEGTEKEDGIKDAEKEEGEKNAEGGNEGEKKEDVKKEEGERMARHQRKTGLRLILKATGRCFSHFGRP